MLSIASFVVVSALLSYFPQAIAQSPVYGQCELYAPRSKIYFSECDNLNRRRDRVHWTHYLCWWASILRIF